MSTAEVFLIAMTVILAVPYLTWRIGRLEPVAPLVVVQIVVGVLLGPGVAGAWQPELYRTIFAPDVIQALNGIAWWAVMLFVCLAGIELDLRSAWRHRVESGITAGLALGLPLLLGAAVGLALTNTPGWVGEQARPWQFVLGVGMSCAVTALPILILLMEKLQILRLPLGQRILRYASLDDIAIWGVLALILMDWERLGRQAGFLLGFPLAAWACRALMARLLESDRWFVALIWLALVALAADWAGLHFMVGAFLAGAVLDAHWFDQRRLDMLREHLLLTIMPVFFLSTGLRTNWTMGGAAVVLVAMLLLLASVAGKLVGLRIAGRLLAWAPGEAGLIGWLLQTKALIMIVFANVLLDRHVISAATFTALLLMAIGSTMWTMPMARPRVSRLPAGVFARE